MTACQSFLSEDRIYDRHLISVGSGEIHLTFFRCNMSVILRDISFLSVSVIIETKASVIHLLCRNDVTALFWSWSVICHCVSVSSLDSIAVHDLMSLFCTSLVLSQWLFFLSLLRSVLSMWKEFFSVSFVTCNSDLHEVCFVSTLRQFVSLRTFCGIAVILRSLVVFFIALPWMTTIVLIYESQLSYF